MAPKENLSTTRASRRSSPSAGVKTSVNRRRTAAILERIGDGIVAFDARMNYTYVNKRGGELLGRKPKDLIGKNYWEEFPEAKGTPFADAYVRALETQALVVFEAYYAPWDRWFENRIYPAQDGLTIFFTETTERKRAEQLLKTELQVLENISSGLPLPEILETIVLGIESLSRETIASILLLDPDGIHVRYGAAPHLPEDYNRAIEGAPIGPQEGSCGTAMYLRKPTVVSDIESDPLWHGYRELARQHGLRACWSTPVMSSGGTVLASFAMYYREPRSPERADFILIERATHMAQIAIERRRAEERLEKGEQVLAEAQKIAHLGSFEWDVRTNQSIWSDELFRLYGLEPGSVSPNFDLFLERIHPEDRERVKNETWQAVQERKPLLLEERVVRPDGAERILFTQAYTEEDSEGNPLRLVGACLDITERKRAVEAQRMSEERLRNVIQNSPDTIYTLDLSTGKTNFLNREQFCGYSRAELEAPGSILAALHADDLKQVQENWKRAMSGQDGSPIEYRLQTKSGETTWISQRLTVLDRSEQGAPNQLLVTLSDITERKRAEEARHESDQRVRDVLASITSGYQIIDRHGRYAGFNDAARKMIAAGGRDPDALLGQHVFEAFPETRDLAGSKALFRTLTERVPTEAENFYEAWHRWFAVRNYPTPDGGVAMFFDDITERKRAEEVMRESREQLALAVRSANVGLWDWNLLTNRVYYSPEWKSQLGYEDREISNDFLEWESRVHPDDLERAKAMVGGYIEDPYPNFQNEFRMRHKDGAYRWILAQASLIYDGHGKPIRMMGSHIDITERMRAEESLRESEARFSKIFHASPIGINLFRLSDNRSINANDAFLQLIGYAREELIGHTAAELELFVETEARKAWMETLHTTGKAQGVDARIRRKSGEIRDALASIDIIEIGSERMGLVITADITERKRAEEQVEQQLKRLAALHVIDMTISSNTDLHVTLEVLLDHVVSQLRVDAAAVLLVNLSLNTLEFAAERGFRGRDISQLNLKLGEDYAGKAALERRLISVPDLKTAERPLSKAHLTQDEDFVSYYGVPLIAKGKVNGVLEIFHRTPLVPSLEWLDFLETLAGQAAIAIDDAQLFDGLQRSNTDLMLAYETTIEGWSRALDLRDKETEGHTLRVTETTLRLVRAAGVADDEVVHVKRGALLHDIGKLGVPDHILLKPDKLTDEEWVVMRKHPTYAYELLAPIQYLHRALDIPYCHHEKWDGTGYPRGLKGEQIPLVARLFAVVDVWDALRSDRPYRRGWPEDKVRDHLGALAGTHFDPQAVAVFMKVMNEVTLAAG